MNSRILSLLAVIIVVIVIIGSLLFWQNLSTRPDILLSAERSAAVTQAIKPFNFNQIEPLPLETPLPIQKVALGKRLFHETAFSENNLISCASCHVLENGGVDNLSVSVGINNLKGINNAPTVFNSGYNFVQFWDGRAASLEEQVAGPIHNPVEMGSDWQQVISKLSMDKEYVQAFNKVYSDGINATNIANAIAEFERSLITPNSKFDRYLRGDKDSLTAAELRGYQLFNDYGCISCHQGINIGGNMFQRMGIFADFFKDQRIRKVDLGRFNITGLEQDRYVFKVPGLRNVAVTEPYFHDGSIDTLQNAVQAMGLYQLGRPLTDENINYLTLFLRSLTGQWQGNTFQ